MKGCEVAFKFRCGENEMIEKLDVSHGIREVKRATSFVREDILHRAAVQAR